MNEVFIYSFAFCARRRRVVFAYKNAAKVFSSSLKAHCKENGYKLLNCSTEGCYATFTLCGNPDVSPKDVAGAIRRKTSKTMIENIPELSRAGNVWLKDVWSKMGELTKKDVESIYKFVESKPKRLGRS